MNVFSARKLSALLCVLACAIPLRAQDKNAPDVLVLVNGDTLHGKLVNEVAGKITFHTDAFGDVSVTWDKIKELHASGSFGVLSKDIKVRGKHTMAHIPNGAIDVAGGSITVHPGDQAPSPAPIPTKEAQYIIDYPTLDKQINREPNFFASWNGAATAGATLVAATQNQYTVTGALSLVRAVPSVTWLNARNRTSADFSGSYGKITQPGTPDVKTSIYHVDGERDQYLSTHLFGLAQLAYDHNFAQDLQLQQIYGAGFGWTLFSTPAHEADVKGTLQYEKQQFISGASGTNQELVGSTFSANYMRHLKLFTLAQSVEFIPSYNNSRAYSASETDTFAFPAYKSLSFSLGTIDTYLNDPPTSIPPTKRNSFQFTMGLTYAIKSKY